MTLRRTALTETHRAAGAKMADFGGWEMPIEYPTGVVAEHTAVRTAVGVFAFIATLVVVRRVRDLDRYRYTFMALGVGLLLLPLLRRGGRRRGVGADHRQVGLTAVQRGQGQGLARRRRRGIIAAGGCMANAVANALQSFGAQPRALPLSPTAIWEMVQAGQKQAAE